MNHEIRTIVDEVKLIDDNVHRNHTNILHHGDAISELEQKLGEIRRRQEELGRENTDLRTKLGEMGRTEFLGGGVYPSFPSVMPPTGSGTHTTRPRQGCFYLKVRIVGSHGRLFTLTGGEETVTLNSIHEAEVLIRKIKDGSFPGAGGFVLTDKKRNKICEAIRAQIRECQAGYDVGLPDSYEYLNDPK